MDLPDCPPGAEGYQDTVTEVAKKIDDPNCTKAEAEFQEHLKSLKIKLEDGSTRAMVERSGGRDVSGKWIYLCYPCAAVCSGESVLQNHISGKKHKGKLAHTNAWPLSIFDEHPYHQNTAKPANTASANVLQKMAHAVEVHNEVNCELEKKFGKFREANCHIQHALDGVRAPLVGLEYLIEHPPEEAHYEPKYYCTLCSKQGHPRTIINHVTCYWHRYNYLARHLPKACALLEPYRNLNKYREGAGILINRLVQRVEDKYGRMRPVHIDTEVYDKEKDRIHQWIFKGKHFGETENCTFEEVVDIGLLEQLHQSNEAGKERERPSRNDPSPPVVSAPAKPRFNQFTRPAGRQERRPERRAGSAGSLSDISDEDSQPRDAKIPRRTRDPADDRRRGTSPVQHRFTSKSKLYSKTKAPNYEYKVMLARDKRTAAEESSKKMLAYHEKNPEKHPLYPEEWKKFWNKRYKEIQAEGKDPSKHDFKPEWIVFWTARMKELHDEELRGIVDEIYRKMCLSPPKKLSPEPPRDSRRSTEVSKNPDSRRGRSPVDKRRRSPEKRRSPEHHRRSPEQRRRSPEPRHRSPLSRHRSPDGRSRSPGRKWSPHDRRDRRSPAGRRSPPKRRSPERHPPAEHRRSPVAYRPPPGHRVPTRSRSPIHRSSEGRGLPSGGGGRSRSPLSQREMQPRNRSPERVPPPSLQTVLISDDELRPDDGLSPWNSDNEIGSIVSNASLTDMRSVADSTMSRNSKYASRRTRPPEKDTAAPDDVVATLRLLVALEDYLGSLGPKLIDLLGEALKMEKEKPNSSEELLLRESATVLMETAKEKLKGAAQAGLIAGSAAAAARAAVVRAAATLHEADKRTRARQAPPSTVKSKTNSAVPVAGVGEVDRAQIAQQMAEALIAQGKTDVSSEELAQLVEAVVGMAEAKKREAERKQPEVIAPKLNQPQKMSGTASALQMLQSAYDENDKRVEKESTPDAMDGLSDSDLETLLKNFNELSAEEQHSLIAYLKKLEAREPARVEKLRQYVSDAASSPAAAAGPKAPGPLGRSLRPQAAPDQPQEPRPPQAARPPLHQARVDPAPVLLESDDDDYTVEEVFQSATQKVKENQIRQEMEIVKKSLEEAKPLPEAEPAAKVVPDTDSAVDSSNRINMSSASDLFALVQASLKSTSTPTPAPIVQPPEVVTSNIQPRSFGDLPEVLKFSQEPAKFDPSTQQSGDLRVPPQNDQPLQTDQFNQGIQPVNDRFGQGNQVTGDRFNQTNAPPNDRFNQGNQPPNDRFNQGNQPPNDRFNQGNQPPNDRFNQGNQPPNDRFNQGNQPPFDRFDQNSQPPIDRFDQNSQPPIDRFNQNSQPPIDRFNQGNPPPNDAFNQNNPPPIDRFNQNNAPPNDRFNQGNPLSNNRFNQGNPSPNQGNQFPPDQYNQGDQFPTDQGDQYPNDQYNQGNQYQDDQYNQGNQYQNDQYNQGNQYQNDQYNQGNKFPNDRFNQGNQYNQNNQQPYDNYNQGNQWNSRPNNMGAANRGSNPRPLLGGPGNQNSRPLLGGPGNQNLRPILGGSDNFGSNNAPFNQGLRPNFMNRGQDNRQMNQQFGNDGQNFRGRGRGGRGGMRGRGRGHY